MTKNKNKYIIGTMNGKKKNPINNAHGFVPLGDIDFVINNNSMT